MVETGGVPGALWLVILADLVMTLFDTQGFPLVSISVYAHNLLCDEIF